MITAIELASAYNRAVSGYWRGNNAGNLPRLGAWLGQFWLVSQPQPPDHPVPFRHMPLVGTAFGGTKQGRMSWDSYRDGAGATGFPGRRTSPSVATRHMQENSDGAMVMSRVRVAVNGYGVIGKRMADAVRRQPDMELMGIADVVTDYRLHTAGALDAPVYAATPDRASALRAAGIDVQGALDDLRGRVDVVADCTPKTVASTNLDRYCAARGKAVFQGGEGHALTGHSFVAQANYETALGRDTTRVVSCNTASNVRTLTALRDARLLVKARGVLIRGATDPWGSHLGGIMNTMVPELKIPSHQRPDAQTVVPGLDVVTIAAKAAHTRSHLHYWVVELGRPADRDEVLAALRAAPRIAIVRMRDGIVSLNSTFELMQDLGRPRGDMWEVAIWEDVLTISGNELYFTYQVDNQAIVIPETIGAIRALTGTVTSGSEAIAMTDEALGVQRNFVGRAQESTVTWSV